MVKKLIKKLKLGKVAFMLGVGGALLLGLLSGLDVLTVGTGLTMALVIAGLVIGAMNVKKAEALPVMVASLVLGIGAGVLSSLPLLGKILNAMLVNLAKVAIPVALVVSVVVLWRKLK